VLLPPAPRRFNSRAAQVITVHLVNSKDHRLRKGYGMHLDLLVIAAQVALCSLFGLPWLVAATVRSMTHLKSLAKHGPVGGGESAVESVTENRLTGLCVHTLIGAALLVGGPLLAKARQTTRRQLAQATAPTAPRGRCRSPRSPASSSSSASPRSPATSSSPGSSS